MKNTTKLTGLQRLQKDGLGGWGWRGNLAKAWGNANGYRANKGSWIVSPTGHAVAQGWHAFYMAYRTRIWQWVDATANAQALMQCTGSVESTYDDGRGTVVTVKRGKVATREEQHGRYLDAGPGAWDDRD